MFLQCALRTLDLLYAGESWELLKPLKRDVGLPGGPVVKNPPSNAGDTGSIPGRGTKILHAAGQLSPRTATTELVHLTGAHMPQTTEPTRRGACVPQLEKRKPTHHN